MKPFCITFAGPVGSSKTPIAHYLSCQLDLPIFNNDAIRNEVIGDIGKLDQKEYLKRRDERLKMIAQNNKSFILDASVDRQWAELKEKMSKTGYQWFIISLDLSKDFLIKIWQAKNCRESAEWLDELMIDHNKFLDQYGQDVSLHITDADFNRRLDISYEAVSEWLKGLPC